MFQIFCSLLFGNYIFYTFKAGWVDRGCVTEVDGVEIFNGTIGMTVSGKSCQPWSSESPHTHRYTSPDYFPDSSLQQASSYCRNPSYEAFIWCYTADPTVRWEYCYAPKCKSFQCACKLNMF